MTATSNVISIRHRIMPLRMDGETVSSFVPCEAKTDRVKLKGRAVIRLSPVKTTFHPEDFDERCQGGPLRVDATNPLRWKVDVSKRNWPFTMEGVAYVHPQGRTVVKFDVWLNPTRYRAHSWDDQRDILYERLRVRHDRRAQLKARSLDDTDNWLPAAAHGPGGAAARSTWWHSIVQTYFDDVNLALTGMFSPPGYELEELDISTIAECETYWEYSSPDAVMAAGLIADRLIRSDHLGALTRSPVSRGAHWCHLALTDDILLKIYAKTNNRLRFEIVNRGRIGQVLRRSGVSGGSSLADKLIDLRIDAGERLIRAWAHLAAYCPADAELAALDDFEALLKAIRKVPEGLLRGFVVALVLRQPIRATNAEGAFPRSVCEALAGRGLVQRVDIRARHSQYRLDPRFEPLISRLAGLLLGRDGIVGRCAA